MRREHPLGAHKKGKKFKHKSVAYYDHSLQSDVPRCQSVAQSFRVWRVGCRCCRFVFLIFLFSTSLSLARKSGRLTWVRLSSRKSSATRSCRCLEHFRVSKQSYGFQCWGFLTCAQMLMHAIAHGGCTDTVRESTVELGEKKSLPRRGLEPASKLRPAFQSDTLPAELSLPVLQRRQRMPML